MNLTALIPLLKLLKDAGEVSIIGPPAPDNGNGIESSCYRVDGKLTFACYRKYVDPAASGNDYQDYLTGN